MGLVHPQQSQNRAVPSKNDPLAGDRIGQLEKLVAACHARFVRLYGSHGYA